MQKRGQRLRQRKLQPTQMQKSMKPCAAEQRLDRRGAEHKPAARKRGGSACAAGATAALACTPLPRRWGMRQAFLPAFVQGEILRESKPARSTEGTAHEEARGS